MGKYKYEIQQQAPVQDFDIVFIRHAESHFNQGTFKYIEEQELYDLTWMDLVNKPDFNLTVTYNPDFIDAHITEKGKNQCQQSKELFNPLQIDLILVSPQQRALQTCRQIFGNDHKNVIVHPFITEVFRYSCDISHSMQSKINQFKNYNFNEMKNWTDEWFLEVLSQQKKKLCQKYFTENHIIDFREKQLAVIELLSKGILTETAQQLRQRIWKVKQLIKNVKDQFKAKKIAVVSHHYTTQCLLSSQFSEDGSVKGIGTIENGKPYFRKLEEILKVK